MPFMLPLRFRPASRLAPLPALAQRPPVTRACLAPAANARTAPVDTGVTFSLPIDGSPAGNVRVFSQQYRERRTATASTRGNTVTGVNPGLSLAECQVADVRLLIRYGGKVGLGRSAPQARLAGQGGADSNGAFDPAALTFGYRTGGYGQWPRSRHTSGLNNEFRVCPSKCFA